MLTKIIEMLETFKYTAKEEDKPILSLILDYETQHLKNQINDEIPKELELFLYRRVVSSFFKQQIALNKLEDFNFEEGIKSISMGDTNYSFDGGANPKDIFIAYMDSMAKGNDYICYRKLKW